MYDLHRLRLLLELHRRGTLSAVAQALSYSTSTISQQLSQLETEVGVELLQPAGRRVRLTPQAQILVGYAEILVGQMEAAEAAIAHSLAELTGTVRIATYQTAFLDLVSDLLTDMDRAYPRLRIEVVQDEPQSALPRMTAHEFDLVIVEEFPHHPLSQDPGIDYQELMKDRLWIALPADARVTTDAVWDHVAGRPWAVEPLGTASRDWIHMSCREAGFEPDIRYTTADLLVQRQLVTDGHAVAVLPDLLGPVSGPGIALLDFPSGPQYRKIMTATRRDATGHPAVQACRNALALACDRRRKPPT
ncbi:LysR family transcriptional regulator [Streptomyces sp. SID8361]|nr:LysR family transcriptional regulator [Streptomyces sp. SID8361]